MPSNLILGRLSAALAFTALGITILKIALPTLTGLQGFSAAQIGFVTASAAAAWPAFGLIAGWGLDRFGRAGAFRLGLLLVSGATIFLFYGYIMGDTGLVYLSFFALCIGLGEVLTETSGQTILPDLVDENLLERGNSWLQGGKSVAAMLLAPLLLAVVLGFQPDLTFGCALIAMIIALILLPQPRRKLTTKNTSVTGFFDGLRTLLQPGPDRRFTLLLTLMSLSWGAWMTLIVPYSLSADLLDIGPEGVGHVMTAMGCGSLIGAVTYHRLKRILGKQLMLATDPLMSALFLMVPGFGFGLIPVMASALLAGIGGVTWAVFVAAHQQKTIHQAILGRTVAAYRWIGWTGFFLGSMFAGIAAEAIGLQNAFLLFALPSVAASLLFFTRNPMTVKELSN